ncbi:MAG TPA: GNAT family N-acetyltransferase [Acidimicrobiales bacterium]|nr:GNAT family N-acetyltransferase [Acidimicrobiales bacterium]
MAASNDHGTPGSAFPDPAGLPAGYPGGLEADVCLSDGRRAHIRPILPTDAAGLAAAIAAADAETLRLRFLGWRPVLDDATLQHLVDVDYRWRLALVAFDPAGQGVGVARYEGREGEEAAEVAVAVTPEWRQVGLGSQLLTMLGHAAVDRGIRRFVASYLEENQDVEGLVTASGLPYRNHLSHGVIEVELTLSAVEPPEPPRPDDQLPA